MALECANCRCQAVEANMSSPLKMELSSWHQMYKKPHISVYPPKMIYFY